MVEVTNTRVDQAHIVPYPQPELVKRHMQATTRLKQQVFEHRQAIERILKRKDNRLIAIVGPCSIHDPKAALEYARRLADLAKEPDIAKHLLVVMRLYYQKPRTRKGWTGLFSDPLLSLNGGDIEKGAELVRSITHAIVSMGLPVATEVLDQWMIQYIDDLVSWCCIGARTVESQPHRQLASALSTPVGMKNTTDGGTVGAINGVAAANSEHKFSGMTATGRAAEFKSLGNPYAHVVLRGGGGKPNYDRETVAATIAALDKDHLLSSLIIDAAHENSNKDHKKQRAVVDDVVMQRLEGNDKVVGFMVESNLNEGRQDIVPGYGLEVLKYGVSITDPCIDFRDTEKLLRHTASRLKDARSAASAAA